MLKRIAMDLKRYDELRKKISTKDFEGNNKGLDMWLYYFSYVGNVSAIFFAYFLVYPALLKTITVNFVSGSIGQIIAFTFSLLFLSIFEITKRYLVRNLSCDLMTNKNKFNMSLLRWFLLSFGIVFLSFYLSITGSKNLATTSVSRNAVAVTEVSAQSTELSQKYEERKKIYQDDNIKLRNINNDLRQKLTETPLNYQTARKEYQTSIDKNVGIISSNQAEINKIDEEYKSKISTLDANLQTIQQGHASEDSKNILLFIIIVIFNELVIIGGLYFREWYEYNLYVINQQKFEKIYQKKDRYRALLAFIYRDGKLAPGDKVMSGMELKEIVANKTTIANSNKVVDEFLKDMDNLGIFNTIGKRRFAQKTYEEAGIIVEHYDDAFRVLENMK